MPLTHNMATRQLLIISIFIIPTATLAGWFDSAKDKLTEIKEEANSEYLTKSNNPVNNEQIANGLKEALNKGADFAVNTIGKKDGFLKNKKIAIPMPENLKKVEDVLRKTGQDKYADEFIVSMNRAAESAVPLTVNILKTAISKMTINDARNILYGPDDAATQYLKKTSEKTLTQKISPIVKQATDNVNVTRRYKELIDHTGILSKYLSPDDYDIDTYITNKTLNGLFTMIAVEEKKIRDNPLERTTDLLKSVFGNESD